MRSLQRWQQSTSEQGVIREQSAGDKKEQTAESVKRRDKDLTAYKDDRMAGAVRPFLRPALEKEYRMQDAVESTEKGRQEVAKGQIKTDRIGQTVRQKNGMLATITEYRYATDMTVRFEDGTVGYHKNYYAFVKGNVSAEDNTSKKKSTAHTYHTGDQVVCDNNLIATVIAYRRSDDIDVQFEDGTIVRHITWQSVFQQSVTHPAVKAVCWPHQNLEGASGKKLIGRKRRTLSGYRTLVDINGPFDVSYLDENGVLRSHRSYNEFLHNNTYRIKARDNAERSARKKGWTQEEMKGLETESAAEICGIAEEADLRDICSFYREVCKRQQEDPCGPDWHYGIYPSEEDLKAHLEKGEIHICRICKEAQDAEAVQEPEQGEIVSAAVLEKHADARYREGNWKVQAPDDRVLTLHLFAVHPDFRGRNLAGKMLAYMFSWGRQAGYLSIQLDVLKGNVPAEKLYVKHGFRFAGEYRVSYEDTGEQTVHLYEKDLRQTELPDQSRFPFA